MPKHEWIHLTRGQIDADADLGAAVARFKAPRVRAGQAAESWLKGRALQEATHIATYILLVAGEVVAFYSLGMSEVELRTAIAGDSQRAIRARAPADRLLVRRPG